MRLHELKGEAINNKAIENGPPSCPTIRVVCDEDGNRSTLRLSRALFLKVKHNCVCFEFLDGLIPHE